MTTKEELERLENYLKICKPHERPLLSAKRQELLDKLQDEAQIKGYANEASKDFVEFFNDVILKQQRG